MTSEWALLLAMFLESSGPKGGERVAIVGSRDFVYLDEVRQYVDSLPSDTVVISGGARGVDRTAEKAARKRGLSVEVYRARWDEHGRKAGYIRNEQIVAKADRVAAFWDGQSRGTAGAVRLAREAGKPVRLGGK